MTNEALRERMLSGGAGWGARRPVEGAPGRDSVPELCAKWGSTDSRVTVPIVLSEKQTKNTDFSSFLTAVRIPNVLGLSLVFDLAAAISR